MGKIGKGMEKTENGEGKGSRIMKGSNGKGLRWREGKKGKIVEGGFQEVNSRVG